MEHNTSERSKIGSTSTSDSQADTPPTHLTNESNQDAARPLGTANAASQMNTISRQASGKRQPATQSKPPPAAETAQDEVEPNKTSVPNENDDWKTLEEELEWQEMDMDSLPKMPRRGETASPTSSEKVKENFDERIYVLGVGAVGTFIAHSLRGVHRPPPVTLLLHSRRNIYKFEERGGTLEVWQDGRLERIGGFDYEQLWDRRAEDVLYAADYSTIDPSEQIHNLIVTTKSLHTLKAIRSVAHRLGPSSTICFMQNGMGVLDELNSQLFTDPATRPRYITGIVSHGIYQKTSFSIEHRGKGTIALSPQAPQALTQPENPTSPDLWPLSTRHLMRTLTRTSVLCALGVHPKDLLSMQLEKLAANCIINPLTVIYNCRNGDLGLNPGFRAIMRLLIAEISLVYRSLPELKPLGQAVIDHRFSPKRIEFMVQSIMKTTAPNLSSMWQDVFGERAEGRMTEMAYLNGYIVRRGEEMGIKCICNYMMTQQVEAQRVLQSRKRLGLAPFEKYTQLDEGTQRDLHEAQEANQENEDDSEPEWRTI